ncbi:SDR family oxidoreductase [Povalibacter sp.]|uniref:SDR family oxidoreductase n=1 Tax=Povalibacter sp. TaxID=1962978 RepID=UPI002F4163DB
MDIRGSTVFVTGANRGIGLAFAREALSRGASKVYAGMRNTKGFSVDGLVPVSLDVTDQGSVDAAAARCGDTTLLVNNAGIARTMDGPLDERMEAMSRELFETNYYGMIRVTRAFVPGLAARGDAGIINVLSSATWRSIPALAAYAASKAAAWSFTNTLRLQLQLSSQRIQVLALHVGFVDTDLARDVDRPKSSPLDVVSQTFDALVAGEDEVFADSGTKELKRGLSATPASYIGSHR